jgi:hypothetical protein
MVAYLNLTKELEGYLHPDLKQVWYQWITTPEGSQIHEEMISQVSGWNRIQEDDWFLKIWACLKRYPESLSDDEKYQSVIKLIEILGYPFITDEEVDFWRVRRGEINEKEPYFALLEKQVGFMCSDKSLGSMNDYSWDSFTFIRDLKNISNLINEKVISGEIMKFRKPKELEYFSNLRNQFPYFAYLSLYSSPIRDSYVEIYNESYQRITFVLPPAIFMKSRSMALMNWKSMPF